MENEIKNNQAQSFRPIVGIDLGTTNSAVAYIHKGKSKIMTNNDGKRYIPSVVLIDPSGKVIVGENARSALIAMPDRTKAAVKREMGSGELSTISGKRYSPEEVSAFIIKEIKELVDEVVGEGEKEAVITVPAYFTDGQRQAVKKAGELAGFVVERIINEPTAAALAFGFEHLDEDRHLLVYDLGGGTFDVSIVEIMDGIIEVKATAGNSKLGGEDFDWLLVDWLAGIMISEHQVDPRDDVRGLALLKEEAEKAKIQLSRNQQIEISIPVVMMKNNEPLGLYKTITQKEFITLIEPLLQETMDKVSEVLTEANLEPQEVDDILLVGGSTRIPYVEELIATFFGASPRHDIHPDEAVALGAAVQAGLKSGALSESGLIVTDVAPFSMGIAVLSEIDSGEIRAGAYKAIITKNTTIPVTRTETFYTSSDDQTEVQIEVFQGEQEWVQDNHFINDFLLEGLPPGPAGAETIEVTFRYNLNGILEVTAKSISSGSQVTVTLEDAIDRSSEEAFQESIEKVETASNDEYSDDIIDDYFDEQNPFDLWEDDKEESTLADLLKEAKQWEKRYSTELKNVSKEERKQLREGIKDLKNAIQAEDFDDLEEAIDMAIDIFIELEI